MNAGGVPNTCKSSGSGFCTINLKPRRGDFRREISHIISKGVSVWGDFKLIVQNAGELAKAVVHLFTDEGERRRMEQETLAICQENKGAARKSAVLLHEMLEMVEARRLASGQIKSTDKVENFQTYFYHLIHSREAHGIFWQLLAYCAGVGGSILIIGSAAGVVVMGLEKITFGWYMKHVSWIAFAGYLAGILSYWVMRNYIFTTPL